MYAAMPAITDDASVTMISRRTGSGLEQPAGGGGDPVGGDEDGGLQGRGVGHGRHIGGGQAHDRGVEVVEAGFGFFLYYFGGHREGVVVLADHEHPSRPAGGGDDGVAVERRDRAQVDDLDLAPALGGQTVGGLHRQVALHPVGDDGGVGPGPDDLRQADR